MREALLREWGLVASARALEAEWFGLAERKGLVDDVGDVSWATETDPMLSALRVATDEILGELQAMQEGWRHAVGASVALS